MKGKEINSIINTKKIFEITTYVPTRTKTNQRDPNNQTFQKDREKILEVIRKTASSMQLKELTKLSDTLGLAIKMKKFELKRSMKKAKERLIKSKGSTNKNNTKGSLSRILNSEIGDTGRKRRSLARGSRVGFGSQHSSKISADSVDKKENYDKKINQLNREISHLRDRLTK